MLDTGSRRVLIINTGVSTVAPLQKAIAGCSVPTAVSLADVYFGPRYRQTAAELEEQPRGGHADELETSIMLAIAPDRVRMQLASFCIEPMLPGPFNRSRPGQGNYSPSGVYGDPRRASRSKGERLLEAMLDDLINWIGGQDDAV
jgi:creatinine amidohydrolase